MKRKMPVKIPDMVIILLALGLTGFSAFTAYIKPGNSSRVLIRAQDGQWVFPLNAEETLSVGGPLGNTVVRIHGNEAWVESSPCTNQICVASGHVNSRGAWVACLPNNVMFIIEGNDGPAEYPDIITR